MSRSAVQFRSRAPMATARNGDVEIYYETFGDPGRLLSMTSVMSATGEPDYGQSSPEAFAVLMSPPASGREEYVENHLKALAVYGSKPEWQDDEHNRARAGAAYDRCFCPSGIARQVRAIVSDGPRADALRKVTVPALVLHGSRDTLIDPSGGRRTAELIP